MADNPCATAACPYCGLTDHTGREHFQFVMALQEADYKRIHGDPEWWHDYA